MLHWVGTHVFHIFNIWLLVFVIISAVVASATSFVEVAMVMKLNDRLPKEERFPEMFYYVRWMEFNRAYKAMFGGDRLMVARNSLYSASIVCWIVSGCIFVSNLIHRFHW
ncbi:MAG TPA: hypothetical protein VKT75_08560 [Acidobacteriaceae bacterium]|nr:hypothetical protein [Acidobacteriaceae bacterium]